MADKITLQIRKKIGENFIKAVVDKKLENTALRELDAITGKDHSWIGKFQRGETNFTINSLCKLLIALKIQPKEIFDFEIKFPKE